MCTKREPKAQLSFKCDIEVFKHLFIPKENYFSARMMQESDCNIDPTLLVQWGLFLVLSPICACHTHLHAVRGPTLLWSEDDRQPLSGEKWILLFFFIYGPFEESLTFCTLHSWSCGFNPKAAQLWIYVQLSRKREMCWRASSQYKLIKIIFNIFPFWFFLLYSAFSCCSYLHFRLFFYEHFLSHFLLYF